MTNELKSSSTALVRPVILCGGLGESLWPVSRSHLPKPLADFDGGLTLLQATLRRVSAPMFSKPILVSGEEYRFLIRDQLADLALEAESIILETVARDTAPAVALSAEWLTARHPDETMLVLASDHVISDQRAFESAVRTACDAAQSGRLITMGIVPTRAETSFGYIKAAPAADSINGVSDVLEFVEKPRLSQAEAYLNSGDYFWNAGIFVFRAQDIRNEIGQHAPGVAEWAQAVVAGGAVDADFFRPLDSDNQASCPAISIEVAVMERSSNLAVLPVDMGWSDLGTWSALRDQVGQDADGNALQGNALAIDSAGSLVFGYDNVTVAVVGVEDLMVVATRDAVLVTSRDKAHDVGKVVEALKSRGDSAGELPSVIHRPWGTYQTTDRDDRFQTKRIVVKPGAKLSSQLHHHRSEHWVVVSGTAEVTVGEKTFLLHENQSTYINAGTVHRLANPGKVPLHLVEVQCGTYLGEDDIVRFEDVYGRSPAAPSSEEEA